MVPRQNKGENIYEGDCESTWRATLEWVKWKCITTEDDGHLCIDWKMIDKELEDETG